MKNRLFLSFLFVFLMSAARAGEPFPLPFSDLRMEGPLHTRLRLNMQRLGEEKYLPDNVFLTMEQSGGWPGDTEGRTLLGLVLDAQALHTLSPAADEMVRRLPAHLNELGYMGPVFRDVVDEQQLAGNGWMLRGLCEYYEWKRDTVVPPMIRRMARNLFLSHAGEFARYPIDADERRQGVGEASGSVVGRIGRWQLSSDVGCVFIGLDGLVQALAVTGDEELRPVVEEMAERFLQMDLTAIKAQTHATLTACRALLRYAALTGNRRYTDEAARRFQLYTERGMTEHFANYNWFCRYDTWTEPCAIVDSYLLAVQLWQQTRRSEYLEWAEQIYFNALCHAQRRNGGFGCDNCPGLGARTARLNVVIPEAHWCCTMRGAEGLSAAARYSAFRRSNTLFFPFLRQASFQVESEGATVQIGEETDYPFAGGARFSLALSQPRRLTLCLPRYGWMDNVRVVLNGRVQKIRTRGGFLVLTRRFRSGDVVELRFRLVERSLPLLNAENALPGHTRRMARGPLLLGQDGEGLRPVWHLADPDVWEAEREGPQILFPVQSE